MPKKPSKLVEVEPSTLTAAAIVQIDTINQHWRTAEFHHQQSCGHLIMAGHQLLDLKKQTKHGEWQPLFKSKSEPEFRFEFSSRWAGKLMQMAEMSKKKLKDLGGLPFDKAFNEWTLEQLETLQKSVTKRGDGETFRQLALDWGLAKAPQGAAVKGGAKDAEKEASAEDEPSMEEVAFILFSEPVQQISTLRSNSNYQAALHSLPVAGDTAEAISLTTLERDLETMLVEVREAKESRAHSHELASA